MNFRIALQLAILPALMLPLAGCPSLQTRTTGLTSERIVRDVCVLWRPITYDSKVDDPLTQDEIKINNAKRNGFCGE